MESHYQIVRPLGQGSPGKTFLALDQRHSPPIACVLKALPLRGRPPVESWIHHLQNFSTHPQIPTVLDWFATETQVCCVWEYIKGRSLETLLAEEGSFTIAQVIQVLDSILPVLELIHQQQFYHGDIKPANLIYASGRSPVLMLVDSVEPILPFSPVPSFTLLGSPEYAAPEQLQGQAGFASDLYSLGLTCIHLLTDLRPFDLMDGGESRSVWRSYYRPLESDSASETMRDNLCRILDRMVEPDLHRRFQSAPEVLETMHHYALVGKSEQKVAWDGESLAQSQDLLPAPTWNCVATLMGHGGLFATINTVVISPDGSTIASGSDDKTLRLWDMSTAEQRTCLTGHSGFVKALAWSSEGILASGSQDRTVRLWDWVSQQNHRILGEFPSAVQTLSFSPDGQALAIGGMDKILRLWHLPTSTVIPLLGHSLGITTVSFSPDGSLLASGSQDRTVRLWDWRSGTPITTLTGHTWAVRAVTFSPDGKRIASAGDDNQIRLWDVGSGETVQIISGHSWTVSGLVFSPDGSVLISASWDKTLKLWDGKTGQEQAVLSGHDDAVYGVAISLDGTTIASCSQDKTIRLWRSARH
ncbi:hypothetical protein BST81_07300 [Leptolyngbya sp. 'hensonii']|uniref:serine/threonine-protein kinase n=1 Tax=Leptolyngbya sp. 'hensonii' TaxID=1922337 RepID=UPI00094FD519|nr:serine/threonine-protein kinase [Leptolyngbya sp. 'hensonii']OLP19022.1 hypothetical protein BST81_07300 [Leptolyngbya sp. 'hensonii']